VHWG